MTRRRSSAGGFGVGGGVGGWGWGLGVWGWGLGYIRDLRRWVYGLGFRSWGLSRRCHHPSTPPPLSPPPIPGSRPGGSPGSPTLRRMWAGWCRCGLGGWMAALGGLLGLFVTPCVVHLWWCN